MIRLMIVDDHPVFRRGVAMLLATMAGVEIVGQAGSAREAVDMAARLEPDVVLMDVRLGGGSGVEACREIRSRRPAVRVLMLSAHSDERALIGSLLGGASGYVIKTAEADQLFGAIATIASGGSTLDSTSVDTLLAWLRREHSIPGPDLLSGLSVQERNILPLIAQGKTNREIAASLGLTENTVKTYISDILQKLQVTRRSELAAFIARLHGATRAD